MVLIKEREPVFEGAPKEGLPDVLCFWGAGGIGVAVGVYEQIIVRNGDTW